MNISSLSATDQQRLAEKMLDVQWWAEHVLKDPETQEPFKANYVQRRLFDAGKKHKRVVARIHRRGGKALPLSGVVYTPDGPSTMGAMHIGTTVCTPNGGTAQVTQVHPQGLKQVFRVHLDDGTFVDCCEDHLWEVYCKSHWLGGKGKSRQQYTNKVLTTCQILSNLSYKYSNRSEFNYKINPIQPVQYTKKDLPIHPYLLGVLLGDGYLKQKHIHSNDPQIISQIQKFTEYEITKQDFENKKPCGLYYIRGAKLIQELKDLNLTNCLSQTKFIPRDYLYSNIEDRLEIVRGLMDTDGSADTGRKGQAEFCSVSLQLATDMMEILRSLGCKVRIKESEAGYTLKDGTRKVTGIRYRLGITIPQGLEIFHLDRKKCEGLPERYLRRTIVNIEPLDEFVEMQCIAVDSPQHLYITDNYTPTHNTQAVSVISLHAATIYRYHEILIVAPDQSKVSELFVRIRAFIAVNPALAAAVKSDAKNPERIAFENGSVIQGKTTGAQGKNAGKGLRSKGADLVIIDECAFLQEADYVALNPIIIGDRYRKNGVQVYACSTPLPDLNRYHEWCTDKSKGWEEVHVPISENPDWDSEDDKDRQEIYSYVSALEWEQEYEAQFPGLGMNAIRKEDITACLGNYSYRVDMPLTGHPRVIGVDWDKYQAGVNIAVVELDPILQKYKVIYHEEVPRSEYTLIRAVERIKALNDIFSPDYIFVDRGYNEMGVETLKDYGIKNPSSNLAERVVGVSFSEHVQIPDPVDGKMVNKRFKGVMANNLFKLIEDHRLLIPSGHEEFIKQLTNYRIVSYSESGFKTASKNEHIFDAVGLACWGLWFKFANQFKRKPAKQSYAVAPPQVVKSKQAKQLERKVFDNIGTAILDKKLNKEWARGNFSTSNTKRSTF